MMSFWKGHIKLLFIDRKFVGMRPQAETLNEHHIKIAAYDSSSHIAITQLRNGKIDSWMGGSPRLYQPTRRLSHEWYPYAELNLTRRARSVTMSDHFDRFDLGLNFARLPHDVLSTIRQPNAG